MAYSNRSIYKTFQGAIVIEKYKGVNLVSKQYIGYSLKEANKLFTEYYKNFN